MKLTFNSEYKVLISQPLTQLLLFASCQDIAAAEPDFRSWENIGIWSSTEQSSAAIRNTVHNDQITATIATLTIRKKCENDIHFTVIKYEDLF